MADKAVKVPSAEHPIAIGPADGRIVVTVAGRVVADTRRALTMREAAYPPVHYIPRADVDPALLQRSDHASYCPYKGDCSYWTVAVGDERRENAAWSYEAAFPAVAAIEGHLAFYPDRVDSLTVQPLAATA